MDSVKIANANAGDGSAEREKDFHRKLAYDPAVLKRQKLWSKDQLAANDRSGRIFSRVGAPGSANGRDSLVGTMTSHQGDRKENPPDSKHKEGDTQKYNGPSESRSHGARSNGGAGIRDNAPASSGAKAQYSSQLVKASGKGLDDATGGLYVPPGSSQFDTRHHGSRSDNGGQGVRTTPDGNQQYPSQAIRRKRAGLGAAQSGQKWNSDSRSHVAHDQHEPRSVKLSRGDNTLNRSSL